MKLQKTNLVSTDTGRSTAENQNDVSLNTTTLNQSRQEITNPINQTVNNIHTDRLTFFDNNSVIKIETMSDSDDSFVEEGKAFINFSLI